VSRLPPFILSGLVQILLSSFCIAGRISEIGPTPREVYNTTHTAMVTLPPLIEFSGLDGLGWVELVIVDASPGPSFKQSSGTILQTVLIPPGHDTRVVTESTWPANTAHSQFTTLAGNQKLNLGNQPRTLFLFDRPTGLVAHGTFIREFLNHGDSDANLLDVVTYGPAGTAIGFGSEPVLEVDPGQVIAKPMQNLTEPWANQFIVGKPTLDGMLTNITPAYLLNPGLENHILSPSQQTPPITPEPSSGVLLFLVLAAYGVSANRCD